MRRLGLHSDAAPPTDVGDALAKLREISTTRELLDAACGELCRTCGFDRAIFFRLDGSDAIAEAAFFRGDPEWARELLRFGRRHRTRLDRRLLERETRRPRARLVRDARSDARVFKPFVLATKTTSYVVAPVMANGRIAGFLHADRYFQDLPLGEVDRERLWTFAEGFAHALARVGLAERLHARGNEALEPAVASRQEAGGARHQAPGDPANLLTRREMEVLAMMAEGATNDAIADRLVMPPGRVKRHVKHLLRKLRATNRAEAVARYPGSTSTGGPP